MKRLVLLTNILFMLFLVSCQVKEKKASNDLISGHTTVTNTFKLQTPTSGDYASGDVLSLKVTFPFPVTVTGTPRLELTIGATTKYANYASGNGTKTLTFTYTFVVADEDSDGIEVKNLGLNGGTLTFDNRGTVTNCDVTTVTSKTFSGVTVDNTSPTITGFALSNLAGFYHAGQKINFVLTYSEDVYVVGLPSFKATFTTGGETNINYVSGSGTNVLLFSYTIDSSYADINGFNSITSPIDLNSGSIKDAAGNNAAIDTSAYIADNITYSQTVLFDGRLPYVTSASGPAAGTYGASENLDITLTFDRIVTVTGSPYIELNIGGTTRQAAYTSGSGTRYLLFRYTTVVADSDTNGIVVGSTIKQNSGDIKGSAAPVISFFEVSGNNSYTPPITTGVDVDGSTLVSNSLLGQRRTPFVQNTLALTQDEPIISKLALSTSGTYQAGGLRPIISVTFEFNKKINVVGQPSINFLIGNKERTARYSSGSGTENLSFNYYVEKNDLDLDGIEFLASKIDLNGGSIKDYNSIDAKLDFNPAKANSITVAPQALNHWYDLSDKNAISFNSDRLIELLKDKVRTLNFSHSKNGSEYHPEGYTKCSRGENFFAKEPINFKTLIAVIYPYKRSGYIFRTKNNDLKLKADAFNEAKLNIVLSSWDYNGADMPILCEMDGELAEMLIFDRLLNDEELDEINSYFKGKYGEEINSYLDHPDPYHQ